MAQPVEQSFHALNTALPRERLELCQKQPQCHDCILRRTCAVSRWEFIPSVKALTCTHSSRPSWWLPAHPLLLHTHFRTCLAGQLLLAPSVPPSPIPYTAIAQHTEPLQPYTLFPTSVLRRRSTKPALLHSIRPPLIYTTHCRRRARRL